MQVRSGRTDRIVTQLVKMCVIVVALPYRERRGLTHIFLLKFENEISLVPLRDDDDCTSARPQFQFRRGRQRTSKAVPSIVLIARVKSLVARPVPIQVRDALHIDERPTESSNLSFTCS